MDVLVWVRVQMMMMDAATALVSFAANWLLQSTLLIAVGLAAARLLRDRGAAIQSAIFRTTLAAALACPLATSLLARCGVSGWSLEMPTAWTYEEFPAPIANDAATAAIDSQFSLPAAEPMMDDEMRIAGASLPMDAARDAAVFAPQPPFGDLPPGVRAAEMAERLAPAGEAASVSPTVARPSASVRVPTAVFDVRLFGLAAIGIALAWLAASAVLLTRLLRAWRRLQQLRGAAAPAELAAQNACRELAALLNVSAPELLRSPYLASPCLAGLRRPAVLLPEANPSLPIRDVLIHELAHLRRRDGHWNLLRRLAEAAFFYQPLLWLLARRLEAAAEEVCDDYVVHFGGNRERYARGLVEIAELSVVPAGAAGVAMVSLRSILARRIVRILDSSRSLSTRVGNLLLAVVIAAGLGGVMAAGFVGLGSQRSQAEAQASDDDAAKNDDKAGDAPSEEDKQEGKAAVTEPQEKPAAENKQTQKQSDETKTTPENQFQGVVAGANGQPVAGAKLYWLRSRVHDIDPQPPQLLATTDKDGRYHLVEPPPVPAETPASWEYMDRIVIVAPGHGFKFTSAGELSREMGDAEGLVPALARALLGGRKGVTSLPPAGDPIRGRLVDVNGQPVAGAKVRIRWFADAKDQRSGVEEAKARGAENPVWQGRVGNLLNVIEPAPLRDALPSAVTDADGKFELRDLGVGRLVQLLVEGDAIEATEIVARNEPGEKIVLEINWISAGKSLTVYPKDFLHAVGPSKPVTGRVLDLDNGQPIAGAMVRAFQVHGEQISSSREREHFAVRTDAEGRFRITGLPVGKKNELVAFAIGDAPYIPVAREADTSAPGAELQLDFRLKRGVWAEGRVCDAETRKPFTGEISYYFFRDRKLEEAIPGLKEAYVDGLYWTNADGEFRVPVLPTRGILAFRYDGIDLENDGIDRFARGFGADKIAGSEDVGGAKGFPTAPFYLMPTNYERIAEVPATDGQQTVRVDMPLFASPPVTVHVVDADGQPAIQFQTYGANERWGWQTQEGPQFEIQDLQPGQRRKVLVFQRETNLGGGAHVKYGDKEVVEIKLTKCGSVRGRLLDADGEPIDDATLQVQYEKLQSDDNSAIWAPHRDLRSMPTNIPVDKQGRFRLDGLIPGWTYHAYASAQRELNGQSVPFIIGTPFTGVQIEPGEEKDLGDVTAKANKPNLNKDEAKDSNGSQVKPSKGGTAQKPIEKAAAELAKKTANETTVAERRQLHGRVVDEAGRPIAGARVRLLRIDTERTTWVDQGQVVAEAISETDGTFAIDFSLGSPFATREEFISSSNVVLADAENHVFDWQHVSPGEAEITLQLSAEDLPIEGRVLDLEGRPIAGVRVGVNEISGGAENLDQWVEQAKRNPASLDESMMTRPISARNPEQQPVVARYPGNKNLQPGLASLLPAATTDENGSFRLAGLGCDRLVRLELSGAGIAKTWLNVVTRDMPDVPYPNQDPRFRVQTCFGRRFKFAAEPEQPITGVVRDADSGRPLAGVEVRLNQYADSLLFVEGFLSAKTDEQGRYALGGVPKPNNRERSHRLRIVPGGDQPYFRTEFQVAKRDGFEPVQGDVKLKRALWLRGRAIDTATGQPIHGLVEYYPFKSNQAAAAYANFNPSLHLMEGDGYATDEDGNYQIPVLPGRGLLAFIALQGDRFPAGDGVDEIADLRQQGDRNLNIYHLGSLDLATAFREVNPAPGAAEAVCDIELNSLDVARIKLVDADGRPVAGAVAQRLAPYRIGGSRYVGWPQEPLLDAAVEIIGPRDQLRTLMFLHRERKLAAAILLTPDRAPPEAIVLRPAATLSGRIVDREGKPIAGLGITVSVLPPPGAKPLPGWVRESLYYTHQLENASTDKDGAFRIEQVPPGVAYVIYARHGAEETTTRVVEPDEKLDLGDVVLEAPNDAKAPQAKAPAKPEPAAVAPAGEAEAPKTKAPDSSPKDAGSPTTLRGRVLDPEGKPLVGAKVYFWSPGEDMSQLEPKVRTAADGGFEFMVDRSKLKWVSADDPWTFARVIAAADGFGYEWAEAAEPGADGQYVIRLIRDVPIRGRILSLEGQPVAKAKLTLRNVNCFLNNNLDEYIQAEKTGSRNYGPGRFGRTPPGQPDMVETDADGHFTLSGIGAERVANLLLEGASIARANLLAMTRETETVVLPENIVFRRTPDRTFGASFTYLAQPSRLIRGEVRERETRRPIAGVTLVGVGAGMPQLTAKTDEQGKFELHGLGKQDRYFVNAMPAYIYGPSPVNSPFLAATRTIDDTPGIDPIEVDFELVRGIQVSGRVALAPDGRPNKAQVMYYPLRGNKYTNRIGPQLADPCSSATCDENGRYTIPVLPGPGILCYRIGFEIGSAHREYLQAWMSREEIAKHFESVGLPLPPELGGDNSVLIATGGPGIRSILLSNFKQVAFMNPAEDATTLVSDIEFPLGVKLDVKLVDPDGKPVAGAIIRGDLNAPYHVAKSDPSEFTLVGLNPRVEQRMIVESRERKLAATTVIQGDETGPLTIKLEPCGAVVGRALDVEGEPLANMQLQMPRPMYLPADFMPKTDGEGRFRVAGVVPGVIYNLEVNLPGRMGANALAQNIIVKPGETKDLGDVRIKPPAAMQRPGDPRPGGKPPSAPGAPAKPGNSKPKPDAGGNVPRASTPAPSAKSETTKPAGNAATLLRGQVLGPDQQPVKGARIWLGKPFHDKWTSVAETDVQGAFQFTFETSALREVLAKDSKIAIRLAATAEGLGFAWTDVGNLDAESDELPAATLRMFDDLPVEGRILKEDGQPAVGVTAYVLHIRQPNKPTLDEYIRAARKDGTGFHTSHDNTWDGNVPGLAAAVTDAEGRFRMTGVGAERLALLSLKGAAIHNWWIVVATRGVPDDEPERKASGALHLAAAPYDNHYYARFTHVSEPARTLQGIVRDRETKEPVAGVEVRADFNTSVVATTGADGRFELVGSRKAGSYNLKAKSIAGGYFLREVSIADKPGIEPLDCELEMVKGVAARGRVADRETGQPVGGTVDYYPLFPNPFTSRLGDIALPCSTSPIDKDGAYELEVLPGPGVIVVRNYDKKYAPARIDLKRIKEILEGVEPWGIGNDEEVLATAAGGQALGIIMRAQFKALAPIKPDDGTATLDQDLALVPGRPIKGVVLGADGRPINGALASGTRAEFAPAYAVYEKLAGAEFAVECVTPDEIRTVLFYHPEQKLGAKFEIVKGHEGTLEVRLQACATATGRLLDGGGKPVHEATVIVTHKTSRVQVEEARMWTAMTNGDGVFRVEGLIPGVEYSTAANGKSLFSAKLAPGEVRELGDIKVD